MIKVYGHPRSGNNLLMALCTRAFYHGQDVSKPAGLIGHWRNRQAGANPCGQLAGGHMLYRGQPLDGLPLYLFRDGRDVAVSLWRTTAFLPPEQQDISFSEFLRTPLDWVGTPGTELPPDVKPRNIVEHWRDHLLAWEDPPAMMVRYESLLADPTFELRQIATLYRLSPPGPVPLPGPVGWFPHQGRAGGWRDCFDADDVRWFFEFVPRDFWGLWGES